MKRYAHQIGTGAFICQVFAMVWAIVMFLLFLMMAAVAKSPQELFISLLCPMTGFVLISMTLFGLSLAIRKD